MNDSTNDKKQDLVVAEDENINALVELDKKSLSEESLQLLNQIIKEHDDEKTRDLTYLFNQNQNKKTMIRLDKLSDLQDNLVAQLAKRIQERPDQISNQDLLQAMKITQNIAERGQKQITGSTEAPLIQVNQQTNTVNMGDDLQGFNRDARERVKNAVASLLSGLNTNTKSDTIIINSEDEKDDN